MRRGPWIPGRALVMQRAAAMPASRTLAWIPGPGYWKVTPGPGIRSPGERQCVTTTLRSRNPPPPSGGNLT